MVVREWLRGGVDPERVERVAREAARRVAAGEGVEDADADAESDTAPAESDDTDDATPADGESAAPTVEPMEADNWLSMPVVVDRSYLVKVTSRRNSLVHALFTAGRNLGAVSTGVEGFFEHHDDPAAMARHEFVATRRIRAAGVNAPKPLAAYEIDGLGVLVSEYLPDPRPLSALPAERVRELAPEVLSMLARMHDAGVAHGDLQAENVLLSEGDLYVIDATNVRDDPAARADARAYDLASALATLAPAVGARAVVDLARAEYDDGALLAAREFLPFVALRPDHEFDDARVAGAVEAAVADDAEPASTAPELTPELESEIVEAGAETGATDGDADPS